MKLPHFAPLGSGLVLVCLCLSLAAPPAAAQDQEVRIERTDLTDNLAMLEGQGGNLGVCGGPDGVFLIDDQFAALSEKILASVAEFSAEPLRFVLNTHWHGDHTGGNAAMNDAGALLISQDNVRRRMSAEQVSQIWQRTTPAADPKALPILTFETELTLHLNDQTIEVFHVPHAHTDGDAIVRFVEADVIHTGDVFFNGLYPFIDHESGGTLQGTLDAVERLLKMSDDDTRFIPGHGPVGSRADLLAYRQMLSTVAGRLENARAAGMDLQEFLATRPTAEFDEKWGQAWLSGEKFVEILYGEPSTKDHHHSN